MNDIWYSIPDVTASHKICRATLIQKIMRGEIQAKKQRTSYYNEEMSKWLINQDQMPKLEHCKLREPVVREMSQPNYYENKMRKDEERHLNTIKVKEKWERLQQKNEVTKCSEVNTIQAFRTFYNGILFRSRLEARWAIFFNACGIKWDYEPEGYQLGNGQGYLPDFLLHGLVGRIEGDLYVEVKGKMTQNDTEKIRAFVGVNSDGSPERPLLIVGNIFSHGTNDGYIDRSLDMSYGGDFLPFFNYLTVDGDYFGCVLGVNKDGEAETFGDDCNYLWDCDKEKTEAAFQKALNAQFSREGKYEPK